MKKKALVLAGGYPQIALIEELKKRNIETVLADWNEEPVAKSYADIFYQVSTLDVEGITQVAIDEKVDCIITVCTDQALLTVAAVSEKLGLPCYLDMKTARDVTNKYYMKQVFADYGIPTAKYIAVDAINDAIISGMDFPLIVKPVDCNSSKGVRKVENIGELEKAFSSAKEMSRTSQVIIEEFVNGIELSADIYVEEGKAILLSLTNSLKIEDKDKFVIFRAIYPPRIPEDVVHRVEMIAQQIADAFHLSNTPMLIQLLYDGSRLYVVEFSARTGGGIKHLLIKHLCGFDVINAVVDLTLGMRPHVVLRKPETEYLLNDFIYCKPGKFDHLEGFEELKELGMLHDYYSFKNKGTEFKSVSNSGDRVAGYTILANSPEEMIMKHDKVRNSIRVVDLNGSDMTRHDLLTKLNVQDGYIY